MKIIVMMIIFVIFFLSILTFCEKEEEGLIKGETGTWLSDGKISIRAVAVYQPAETFNGLIIDLKNNDINDMDIHWLRGIYSGRGIQNNVHWGPVMKSTVKNIKFEGIILDSKISQEDIRQTELGLSYESYNLKSGETCRTYFTAGFFNKEPSKVKLWVQFLNGSQSGPFLFKITRLNESS